ncbi:MAG: PEPxxWA-CTERM sorting domain-containing protein [Sphingopyxis sp.]
MCRILVEDFMALSRFQALRLAGAAATIALLPANACAATLIDFNSQAFTGSQAPATFSINGFTFSLGTGAQLGYFWNASRPNANNGTMAYIWAGSPLTIRKDDNSAFVLSSLDLGVSYYSVSPALSNYTLALASGGTATGAVQAGFAYQNYVFGQTINSVTLTNGTNAYMTIDNIATDVAAVAGGVPEPMTWGLMILGFGMIGGAMRRRARTQVRVAYA